MHVPNQDVLLWSLYRRCHRYCASHLSRPQNQSGRPLGRQLAVAESAPVLSDAQPFVFQLFLNKLSLVDIEYFILFLNVIGHIVYLCVDRVFGLRWRAPLG